MTCTKIGPLSAILCIAEGGLFRTGRAEVLYDYFPREEVMLLSKEDGSITVGVETVDSEGLYYWLLQYGESVAAVGPEEVVEKMRKKLATVCAGYGEAGLQDERPML